MLLRYFLGTKAEVNIMKNDILPFDELKKNYKIRSNVKCKASQLFEACRRTLL